MSTQLTVERFREIIETTRNRESDPGAAEAFAADAEIQTAWRLMQEVLQPAGHAVVNFAQYELPRRTRRAFGSFKNACQSSAFFGNVRKAPRTPERAVFLGELARLMALPREEVMKLSFSKAAGLGDEIYAKYEEEETFARLYPIALVARQAMDPSDDFKRRAHSEGGIPLDISLAAVENLHRLNVYVGLGKDDDMELEKAAKGVKARRKQPPIAMSALGTRGLPSCAGELAKPSLLDMRDMPDAFEQSYSRRWNLVGAYTTDCRGAFVRQMQLRIAEHRQKHQLSAYQAGYDIDDDAVDMYQRLSVVLATSSDGRDRGVAAFSRVTPHDVYEKHIWDNSLTVMFEAVKSDQFNEPLALAMVDTGLPKPIIAVMQHANLLRVDMGIRVMAAREALKHPLVSPREVYKFMCSNHRHPLVPAALWRDCALEMQVRLHTAQKEGKDDVARQYEHECRQVASHFLSTYLEPFAEAVHQLDAIDPTMGRQEMRRHFSYHVSRQISAHREFIKGHDFITDPRMLDMIVDGVQDEKQMVELISICAKAKIPFTKKMIVKILQHPSHDVRVAGRLAVPNIDDLRVEELMKELDAEVERDYAAVRERLMLEVIPDYEPVEGMARKRNRNRWPHFPAATTATLDRLIGVYRECYEKHGPEKMCDAFRSLTILNPEVEDVATNDTDTEERPRLNPDDPFFSGDVVQSSLFGDEPPPAAKKKAIR